MQTMTPIVPISQTALWTGRFLSVLVVLFLILDGVTKMFKIAPAVEATVQLGYLESQVAGIGILLLACTLCYVIPRTAVLGAILLTGYLGGATATNLRTGSELFPIFFPVGFGVLVWLGLYLRDHRLRTLFASRKEGVRW